VSGFNNAEWLPWHDANVKLPDTDLTVLCWGPDGYFTGWWDDDERCWHDCATGGQVEGVTHWSEPLGPQGNDGLYETENGRC
jgi:hypothetical protein